MLARRLLSAAVIISGLIALICLDFYLGRADKLARPGLVLAAMAMVVATLSAKELVGLFRHKQWAPSAASAMVISAVAIAICSLPTGWPEPLLGGQVGLFGWTMLALAWAVGISFTIEILGYRDDGSASVRAATSSMIQIQIILLFGFLIAHRLLGRDNALGLIALLTLITSVKMSDAAAYFTGKTIGTIKMSPQLSPGKTVQGAMGAVVGAWLGTAIIVYAVTPWLFQLELVVPMWWVLAYGIAVTAAGVVGDLSISLLKRDARLKDSSSWLPGLGGILDITDSLVFAAPVSYFFWVWLR